MSEIASRKSIEESFVDWEAHVFGFGYGSGERPILTALKAFMAAIGREDHAHAYDYEKLEVAVTAPVAWLLINILCRHEVNIIEYGTSPRYAWLTPWGEQLKKFVDSKSVDELVGICCSGNDHDYCSPTTCNCGPGGYEEGRECINPFWKRLAAP